jgi:threonine/homoserine/homoserine lactone efflux protein
MKSDGHSTLHPEIRNIPMNHIVTTAPFFLGPVLLALIPGPDSNFVLTQSTLQGKTAGLIITFGLCSVLIIHTTAVAFGVAFKLLTTKRQPFFHF